MTDFSRLYSLSSVSTARSCTCQVASARLHDPGSDWVTRAPAPLQTPALFYYPFLTFPEKKKSKASAGLTVVTILLNIPKLAHPSQSDLAAKMHKGAVQWPRHFQSGAMVETCGNH